MLVTKSNYQDFQRFQAVDVSMPADAEATLPALIEAVKSAIPNDRKDAIDKARRRHPQGLRQWPRAHQAGRRDRLGREPDQHRAAGDGDLRPDQGSRLVAGVDVGQCQQLAEPAVADGEASSAGSARSGGYGVGYGAPASVGAALGNRDLGRFSVSIQSDGDLMYAPGVLWTAARHKIPLLAVMHNNRGYHQEVMHVQRLANFRNRVATHRQRSGADRHQHRESRHRVRQAGEIDGLVGAGPINDPADLGPDDQGSRRRRQIRPAGADQCVDAAALRIGYR